MRKYQKCSEVIFVCLKIIIVHVGPSHYYKCEIETV
jgi:hypothetical protein